VKSVYAFHPILRTRNANFIAQVTYEDKKLVDVIRNPPPGTLEERQISDYKIGVVGDFRDGLLSGGLNAYAATVTYGDLGIAPPSVLQTDQTTGHHTAGNFRKYNVDARRLQRVTDHANLLISFSGQKSTKNLASAEKFSLGGPNGVRAFPVGEATADIGIIATLEGRYIVPRFKIFGGDFTVLAFYDHGWAQINDTPIPADTENNRSLGGFGLGVSAGQDGNFIARANIAWRTHGEVQSDPAKRSPTVWLQAVKWF
jgi:hemolysin activation/secretion protein